MAAAPAVRSRFGKTPLPSAAINGAPCPRLSSAASASLIHSSWLSEKRRRAVQQKIQGGMDLISKRVHNVEPSKTELRASIPAYDEAYASGNGP